MHVPGGIFWGYREYVVLGGGLLSPTLGGKDWIARIEEWEYNKLDELMYQYQVFYGDAPDAFPESFVMLDFMTRQLRIQRHDNEMEMELMFAEGYTGSIISHLKNYTVFGAITGFRLRNRTPGSVAKYQITAYR